jgi:hypothetical protein
MVGFGRIGVFGARKLEGREPVDGCEEGGREGGWEGGREGGREGKRMSK